MELDYMPHKSLVHADQMPITCYMHASSIEVPSLPSNSDWYEINDFDTVIKMCDL